MDCGLARLNRQSRSQCTRGREAGRVTFVALSHSLCLLSPSVSLPPSLRAPLALTFFFSLPFCFSFTRSLSLSPSAPTPGHAFSGSPAPRITRPRARAYVLMVFVSCIQAISRGDARPKRGPSQPLTVTLWSDSIDFAADFKMDAEAALLENSPTLSTISSDSTDATYSSGPGSPYSPESPIIVTSSYKKKRDDEVTPRPTPRYPLPSRKPSFRIRPPYLMICISIIEITVHCLGDEATLRRWLVYDPRQRVQGWRFASYMLLHSNALHLALNVVIQLVLATPLEVEQGRIGVATIYLGGGVCGALGASLLQPSLYLVGASAGVYALLTSHLAHLYLCHGELRYAGWRLGAVLLLAGADVASLPIPALLGCGRVGWAAHVAGALAGPLLGLAVFPNQSKKDARGRRFVRYVRLLSAVSVMLLIVGAVLGNVYLIALPQLRKPS